MNGFPPGNIYAKLAFITVVPIAGICYAMSYSPKKVSIAAENSKENCTEVFQAFLKCIDEDIKKCENEVMNLHNCIFANKRWDL
ncbi:hypothetical protein SteCoe_15513 [Stentor coeruleus]|uniref:Uncharacterized protein n=1 Tax=Stentor coeruleus TaxID=5963 RepID=A0A1R2C3N4_9CILI|nr:hypothetical protein SteCoe_15513 [Stentor coeruleus]